MPPALRGASHARTRFARSTRRRPTAGVCSQGTALVGNDRSRLSAGTTWVSGRRSSRIVASRRVLKFWLLGGELEVWLAVGDLGEDAVEVLAGEGPLERPRDVAVVVAEGQQPLGEFVEGAEVVGGQRFALGDREEQLGLVEPGGVDGEVDQSRGGAAVVHAC